MDPRYPYNYDFQDTNDYLKTELLYTLWYMAELEKDIHSEGCFLRWFVHLHVVVVFDQPHHLALVFQQ